MHYTNYEKNKIGYFEIKDTDENFFDTFKMIIQKSIFSVKIEKDQEIPNFLKEDAHAMQIIQNSNVLLFLRIAGLCIWCYKDGKTTIIFNAI